MTVSIKQNSFILGVAGGSGSGKTFFAQKLQALLGLEMCEIISQDNFYIDQSQNFDFDGGSVNFDHPDSIDFVLLIQQLKELKNGNSVQIPVYDFITHKRKSETILIQPKPLIILDGILILHPVDLRRIFDETLFFETPENLRFQRRLHRDVKERGREAEGVRHQFLMQVKPMHDQFVEPSKINSNSIIKETEEFDKILADYYFQIKKRVHF